MPLPTTGTTGIIRQNNYLTNGTTSHCLFCHRTYLNNIPQCGCLNNNISPCTSHNCYSMWYNFCHDNYDNIFSVPTPPQTATEIAIEGQIPTIQDFNGFDMMGNFNDIQAPREPVPPTLTRAPLQSLRDVMIDNSFGSYTTYSTYGNVGSGGWFINNEPKKKAKTKTPEQRYKEMRDELSKTFTLGKDKTKLLDSILKPYLELRDQELLRKVINESKDLRVIHDMRRFIEQLILEGK